jgi:hypothetical protein
VTKVRRGETWRVITVKIDVSGAVKKLRSFRSAGAAFDQRQALTEIGDSVLKWVRDGFATGGRYFSACEVDLMPSAQRSRPIAGRRM